MFPFTLDIYCTSVRPGRGIPHMWLSLRFLLSFYLLKGFFSSFSLLLLRVKGRGCHTLLKPYETNCGLWIWAIQIKFDWLIDWLIDRQQLSWTFKRKRREIVLLRTRQVKYPTTHHHCLPGLFNPLPPPTVADAEDTVWLPRTMWADTTTSESPVRMETVSEAGTPERRILGASSR